MKNIALILLIIAMASCQEDKAGLTDNSFSVSRNFFPWLGAAEIHVDNTNDTLTFLGVGASANDDVILLKIKFNGPGTYALAKNQAHYYSTVGGDVLTSNYELAPNDVGEFVISKYDPAGKLLEGSFKVSLKKTWSYGGNGADILNFTDGHFKGKIEN